MSFELESVNKVLEFITYAIGLGGFLYGGWKMIIAPIKKIYKKIDNIEENTKSNNKLIHEEIFPVIQSLSKEFSKNSGKSIMDRILRIDDNTRLAELRSKLMASNFLSASMVEFDKSGNLVWANKAFINFTGLDLDQLKANGWIVCISEDDREHVWGLWRHSIESNIPFESEFNIKNQSTNHTKHVKCTIFPHKSIDSSMENPILGYYGTIVEINS
jgi:PAS domain S-box-containing protein